MSFPKSGDPHRVRRERSRGAERKGPQGVGNICGQVAKRVRLSTSVSGGAMVVVMATLGALAPSQPPDLQGVQIDARRRNNRRIGPRIGSRMIWWREDPHRTRLPCRCSRRTFLSISCAREISTSYPFYFYHRIASTHCGRVSVECLVLYDKTEGRIVVARQKTAITSIQWQ